MGHHRFGAVALIAALALAGPAGASRPPTKAEASALRLAVGHKRVVSERVSTRDPRYAAAKLDHGAAILHRTFATWWVSAVGSSLQCTVAPASVLADLDLRCSPPKGVAWIDSCGPMQSAPPRLVLACGDGNFYLTNLAWKGWGTRSATATGTAHENDCMPYCAAGRFHTYPVRVTTSGIRSCGAARAYGRLHVAFPTAHPPDQLAAFYAMAC